jgi:vacuolar protein-sorting-associated protein 4
MDLRTLTESKLKQIKNSISEFQETKEAALKSQIFVKLCENLEDLKKIIKGGNHSENVTTRLNDVLRTFLIKADAMKQEIKAMQSGESVKVTNEAENKKKNKEVDKEHKEFEEVLSKAIITEKPNVKWEDVAGLEVAKQTLREAIIFPSKFPQIFVGLRRPWRGILLYGVL